MTNCKCECHIQSIQGVGGIQNFSLPQRTTFCCYCWAVEPIKNNPSTNYIFPMINLIELAEKVEELEKKIEKILTGETNVNR